MPVGDLNRVSRDLIVRNAQRGHVCPVFPEDLLLKDVPCELVRRKLFVGVRKLSEGAFGATEFTINSFFHDSRLRGHLRLMSCLGRDGVSQFRRDFAWIAVLEFVHQFRHRVALVWSDRNRIGGVTRLCRLSILVGILARYLLRGPQNFLGTLERVFGGISLLRLSD